MIHLRMPLTSRNRVSGININVKYAGQSDSPRPFGIKELIFRNVLVRVGDSAMCRIRSNGVYCIESFAWSES
jgi:hypothetical protein